VNAAINATLGILFLVLAFGTVFLMFRLWGHPFDHVTHKSAAPPGLMRLHRIMGLAYFVIYVVLMFQMVPRLWTYQVEFPARTVVHIICGILIGLVLILKLSILRFFRHFEEWMPALGTSLLVLTVILSSLSIPFTVRAQGLDGRTFSPANLERIQNLLPEAGFGPEVKLEPLATLAALDSGRQAMVSQCAVCHDLRTVLLRPRTPSDWLQTVSRMAEKPNPTGLISSTQQQRIVAYLIAITPDLQTSAQAKRQQRTRIPAASSIEPKKLFEVACSQCHPGKLIEAHNFKAEPSEALVQRMVANGMKASEVDLAAIIAYLTQIYGK
jgi:mono/diheme cytochrome c family protein